MVCLVHEIWIAADGNEGCVLAGPRGDTARGLYFSGDARLVHTFEAGSHIDAMRYYNSFLGREPYVSTFSTEDAMPYPEAWLQEQCVGG
jgi:hypothetical protein